MPPIVDAVDLPTANHKEAWQGGLSPAGVDLVAMVVSDSGLASSEPQWWNASPWGCILIGLQPRGGWQVMQRTVQWGKDHLAKTFGVSCSEPTLYAYFACSIRNRLEVWDSTAWNSPMEGSDAWKTVGRSHVKRPSKLVDGSRGGQAFICDLLRPKDGASYNITDQARMQFRSLILVAAGFMNEDALKSFRTVMEDDFQLNDRLGAIFHHVLVGVIISNIIVLALSVACFYAIFSNNIFGHAVSFVVQGSSLLMWAVGATGLLMLGGHPRVEIVETKLPDHIAQRLDDLESEKPEEADNPKPIQLNFGSFHGSVYVADHSHCELALDVVRKICGWDIELRRPRRWKIGFAWWSSMLLLSIALQITGAQVATVSSEIFSIVLLLATSLARGYGVAGPESWMIPHWKSRKGAKYEAIMLGKFESRKGNSS